MRLNHVTARRMATRLPFLALFFGLLSLVFYPGCDTGAIGVNECREIETVRCEASLSCGTISDVESCVRFYETHCLHGLAGPRLPSRENQKKCVEAIEAAGKCAKKDNQLPPEECQKIPDPLLAQDPFLDVCEVIARPWDLPVCSFMIPPEPKEDPDEDEEEEEEPSDEEDEEKPNSKKSSNK